MQLKEIADRRLPVAWEGKSKIPWNDPEFSARMLREHLNQEHAQASRPLATIQRQIDFLEDKVLDGSGARVLDLGCGPGLYCKALADRGHRCTGVDFSPASIEYAVSQDGQSEYVLEDVREFDPGNGYDLVIMTFGEFNAFNPEDGLLLIQKMRDAIWPGGTVVLEVHAELAVRNIGNSPPSWRALASSVFSDHPHIWFSENFFDEEALTAITRHFVLNESGDIDEYINTLQGYRRHDYITLLQHNGFRRIMMEESKTGDPALYFLIAGT